MLFALRGLRLVHYLPGTLGTADECFVLCKVVLRRRSIVLPAAVCTVLRAVPHTKYLNAGGERALKRVLQPEPGRNSGVVP